MAELLLELFSEEIPARMQEPRAAALKKTIEEKLLKEKLFFTDVHTFVTPRRLILVVDGLSLTQENTVVEKRGPRVEAPEHAIEGFLRSTGLSKNELTIRKLDKGEFYFAVTEQKGSSTKETLTFMLEEVLPSISWQKSMRWGDNDIRWIRPLKNICCLFGGDILPITFGHLTANNISEGHRFLSKGRFTVKNFNSLKKELKSRYVIIDSEERKNIIRTNAEEFAFQNNLELLCKEDLLNEVTGLVEWPYVLHGRIDEAYMSIPDEVLISSITTHQKYFCLKTREGSLAPYFIVVSNMKDNGSVIVSGNERVLRARLADAQFFLEQDRKIPLERYVEHLDKVIFHAKLGTIGDKVQRIQVLAKFLAVWIPHAKLDHAERAAILCKADLATEMVTEFPELQGIMGSYYANSEAKEVSIAIKEHYSPLGPDDQTPTNPISIAVALADKIDTLVGLFAIGEKPTGSKDPFALRRASLGVIRIILENRLSIPLKILFEHALKQYPRTLLKQSEKIKPEDIITSLLEFFRDRLRFLLKTENIRYELIIAVFDGVREDDLLRVVGRIAALDKFLITSDGEKLLGAYKRAANILRIEEKKDKTTYRGIVSKGLFEQDEERELLKGLLKAKQPLKAALKESNFEAAMQQLSTLHTPVDKFFANVIVNDENPDIRKNRLKLLAKMRKRFDTIADFSVL